MFVLNRRMLVATVVCGVAVAGATAPVAVASENSVSSSSVVQVESASVGGIRTTKEYMALETYVQQLVAKKSQPQTKAAIARYRTELATKRARTNQKVRDLYQERMDAAKDQRTKSRMKVNKLRAQWKAEVAELKQDSKDALNSLASQRSAALKSVNKQFASRLATLNKEKISVQKKLAKATDPVVKKNLREELSSVNNEIASLNAEKQSDIRATQTKYNDLVKQSEKKFADKIVATRTRGEETVKTAEASLQEVFAAKREIAVTTRTNEFAAVKALDERGVAAIDQMPVS